MKLFHTFARLLSALGMAASVVVLLAMVGLTLAEVAARNLFGTSTFIMNEMVGYGVAAVTMLALGNSFHHGTQIRMNLLLSTFHPGGLPRRLLEILCVGLALLAIAIALRYFARSVIRNYERGNVSETAAQVPLWIPEAFVIVGFGIFFVQLLSYLFRLLAGGPLIVEKSDEAVLQRPEK